jgi:trk system potassium uptake protein TrkH
VSGALVAMLALTILLLEGEHAMGHLGLGQRMLGALFQSVTARTAGFNTLDVGGLRPPTLLLLCLAMFIGASPGSTGGGVKTTTVAALFATLRMVSTGAPQPRLFDRALPEPTVRRAMAVASLSGLLVAVFAFALLLLEGHDPLRVLFETVSAFGTVGLSTGITGELSTAGRLVIVIVMILGRVGPLTLAFALASRAQSVRLRLPEERLPIG